MGWASCVGDVISPGAWIMSGLLYAWQFPHFNALSWNLRPDYSRAGYRMMAVTNPKLCRKTALRYTAALMGLCYLAPVFDVTNWWFALSTTPLNAYFLYLGTSRICLTLRKRGKRKKKKEEVNVTCVFFFLAWEFHKHSDSRSSRKLFHFSLIHLPALIILMLISKKQWHSNDNKQKDTILFEENRSNIYPVLMKTISN